MGKEKLYNTGILTGFVVLSDTFPYFGRLSVSFYRIALLVSETRKVRIRINFVSRINHGRGCIL